jgi:UDP-glucose 4-epimerase
MLLITGGAGYIGSHVLVELIAAGYRPIVLDNLSNSSRLAVQRVEGLTGLPVPFIEGDVRSLRSVRAVMSFYQSQGTPIEGVIHLAGCKAVGDSVAHPLNYYDVNVGGATALLTAMRQYAVHRLVFSSSACVYGQPLSLPVKEQHPPAPTSPYGRTKLIVEGMLHDLSTADPTFSFVILRYFNPIGAHFSGRIGESPHGAPANLFPYIAQVAAGRRRTLKVFGNDYDTSDGTGVRDYLHVMDVARGHVTAMEYALQHRARLTVNLGTGSGTSVMELVRTFERMSGQAVPCSFTQRRPGDVAAIWADAGRAWQELGWKARYTLEQMCADGWRWQHQNPDGYLAPVRLRRYNRLHEPTPSLRTPREQRVG